MQCVSQRESVKNDKPTISMSLSHRIHQTLNSKASTRFHSGGLQDRKSGSAGMPRPTSYAVFCLKKKTTPSDPEQHLTPAGTATPPPATTGPNLDHDHLL